MFEKADVVVAYHMAFREHLPAAWAEDGAAKDPA
jgi:hypothetical protein